MTDQTSARHSDERLHFLDGLIRQRSLVTSKQRRIVSPGGREQAWLVDLRPILPMEGPIVHRAFPGAAGATDLSDMRPETSAFHPAAIVQEGHRCSIDINAFIIRKERKASGLANDIEGDVNDHPIVVVDDILNSSTSAEKVRAVLSDRGRSIWRVFVVLDFRAERSLDWRVRHNIQVDALFQPSDFALRPKRRVPWRPQHRFHPTWSYAAPKPNHFLVAPRSTPCRDEKRLYVGTDGGELVALDIHSGIEAWSFKAEGCGQKGIWSSPALASGRVVFGGYNGCIYCLDCASGKVVWRADVADWVGSSPAVANRNGLVLVGLEHALPGARGSLAALDLQTGRLAWQVTVCEYIHSSPTLFADDSKVLIGTNGGELICLDAVRGSKLWQYNANGPIKAAPAVSESANVAIAGSFDGCIHLVSLDTGESIAVIRTAGSVYAGALVLGDIAFIGSQDKKLYVVDLIDGRVIKTFALGARIFATPVLLNSLIYVGTTGGILFGIDPASLTIRDILQLPDRIVNSPILSPENTTMIVPVFGNRLFAFLVEPCDVSPRVAEMHETTPERPQPVLSETTIELAYGDGNYFRINEQFGRIARPFRLMPSRRMLGAAVMLAAQTPGYRDMPVESLVDHLTPPLMANQMRVFLLGYQPIGLVSWAYLAEEGEQALLQDGRPPASAWIGGDRPWIVDLVAPFGHAEAILGKALREIFPGKTVKISPHLSQAGAPDALYRARKMARIFRERPNINAGANRARFDAPWATLLLKHHTADLSVASSAPDRRTPPSTLCT